jgi:hypothetical protein
MGPGAKRRASIIVVGTLILFVLTVAGSPASADVNRGTAGGLTYIYDQTQFAGPNGANADAACPPGTHVVGGGGEIGGPVHTNHLNTTFPFDGADADPRPDDLWIAHAWVGSPFPDVVDVIAVCRQGKARYRSGAGNVQPGTARTLRATCPPDTHVSGGGVFVDGGIDDSWVSSSYPYDDRDAGSAPVTVGDPSLPMTGPACPASRHLTAGGIRLGAPLAAEAHPVTMMPFDLADADSIPDDALRAEAGTTSASQTATMLRHAICK